MIITSVCLSYIIFEIFLFLGNSKLTLKVESNINLASKVEPVLDTKPFIKLVFLSFTNFIKSFWLIFFLEISLNTTKSQLV
ncbi:hypothetical protein AAGS39_47610 [Flavobacterium sp. CGRL2]